MDIVSIGGVSIGAILLCIWFAYGLMPELNRALEEREWSRPERESLRQRKKNKKLGIKPDRVAELDEKASRLWRRGLTLTPAELEEYQKLIAERRKAKEWADGMFG